MCGIWAVFGSEADVTEQCTCVQRIAHRGPDAFRMETINPFHHCCLAFRRLAIVDDITGMQPMRLYDHPHVYLIYNGEIYNHRLLRKEFDLKTSTECDGEPIIHLYSSHGPQFAASHLDGVFAFCLFDTANRKVILGRDTYGIRPMFRLHTSGGFLACCSEAKGLMDLTHDGEGDEGEIEPFPPGHVEVYDIDVRTGRAKLLERKRFHKIGDPPAFRTITPPLTDDVGQNIRCLLEAAVDKRLMAERRIGCLLSGGLDSSLVTALTVKLAKAQKLPYTIQTFSVGMEGSPDLKAAKEVADMLGTEHHELVFKPEEGLEVIPDVIKHLETYDITTVRASIGMFLISRYISKMTDTVVILSGEGADELLQGYLYFHKAPGVQQADTEARRLLKDLFYFDVLRCDRATAAWGLEVRVPFLDHKLDNYLLSLPAEARRPVGGVEKHLLRDAFRHSGLLPDSVLWRRKEAFSDGVSTMAQSWHSILAKHCREQVGDIDLEKVAEQYPVNPPHTHEALYYRRCFDKLYPGRSKWLPYFWLPKWSMTRDPSARTLDVYGEENGKKAVI